MHTPAPWGWTYDGSSDYSIGPQDDPQANAVAHVWDRKDERAMANCNLIAAAPELLAALKIAIDWIDPEDDELVNRDEARRDYAQMVAAIAKAENGQGSL